MQVSVVSLVRGTGTSRSRGLVLVEDRIDDCAGGELVTVPPETDDADLVSALH